MVSDFKELLKHLHTETIDSQRQMLSTEVVASSLTQTEVLECGGKQILEESTKSISSKSETDGTAVAEDLLALKFSLEQLYVGKFRMEPKTENGIK